MDDAKTLAAEARRAIAEINIRFGSRHSACAAIDRLANLAASHQAEVERLILYKNLAEEYGLSVFSESAQIIVILRTIVERLTAERDAAFAMSKCECSPDEACANLVRLTAERDEASRQMGVACAQQFYFQADRDALQTDAARYRFMRSTALTPEDYLVRKTSDGAYWVNYGAMDKAVDSAMSKAQGAQT